MSFSLKGTNIILNDSTREYVDKKLIRVVNRFLVKDAEPINFSIEVEKTTRHHKKGKIFRAEANLSVGKTNLYAESGGETLSEAIDLLEEELEREIKKFKGRRRSLMLTGARKLKYKK